MQYSQLGPNSDGGSGSASVASPLTSENDNVSVAKSMRSNAKSTRSFRTVSVGNQELKEPLTAAMHHDDDPFYVFREDLYRKLDLVDDGLAEFLRLVHQTVRNTSSMRFFIADNPRLLREHFVVRSRSTNKIIIRLKLRHDRTHL